MTTAQPVIHSPATSAATRAIHRRAWRILAVAGPLTATLVALLAALARVPWQSYLSASPILLPSPSWSDVMYAAAVVLLVAAVIVASAKDGA